ncbi:hypothetical protein HHK36_023631 [Tetracentron sinense]|uniref:TF-B3 domain-containing protein n=1 Tax=Tetracentron sinense TaxID=13715 RepID=A0A834YSQ6_TETSI|nr:hypothetical protein HHK36_023631 [Tetracentron sinense]
MDTTFFEPLMSLNHENNPRIEENDLNSDMGLSQFHSFPTPESQTFISTSQSFIQEHNELQQHPFVFSADYATPPVFPVFPLGIEQNGVDNGVPISIMGSYFDGCSSDKQIGGNCLENSWIWESPLLSRVKELKPWDSLITKAARSKRKIARQTTKISTANKISSGVSSSFMFSGRSTSKKLALNAVVTQNNNDKEEIFTFSTPDNKKLKLVLQKELKNSDVSSLGRVVLPKRDAEAKLPRLTIKEGIQLAVREVGSTKVWYMRYRFWPNNKSRMYVLENTGEFVKQNHLKSGDTIILYEDESKQIFIFAKKEEKPISESLKKEMEDDGDEEMFALLNNENKEQEEASLAPLKKELKEDTKEEEDKSQMIVAPYDASAVKKFEEVRNDSTHMETAVVEASSSNNGSLVIDFDDCFCELDMLPDFNHYDLSLYNDLTGDHMYFGGDNTVVVK